MILTVWLLSGLGVFTLDCAISNARGKKPGWGRRLLSLLLCLVMGPLYMPLVGLLVLIVVPVSVLYGIVKAMREDKASERLTRYCRRAA